MLAMRYGALPLVRETGGLADTVENFDGGNGDYGSGFVFNWEEPEAVLGTLRWALDTYRHRPHAWRRMQKRAMRQDFSWNSSAGKYIELYENITGEPFKKAAVDNVNQRIEQAIQQYLTSQ